jgi:hypothetical protein
MGEYEAMYKRSITDSEGFWGDMARAHLDWFSPFTSVQHGTFAAGDIAWFLNGKLNASHQCIDRHIAAGKGEKVAILFEGDHPSDIRTLTYNQLFTEVCKCANALKRQGVKKGDAVCLYMPMVPAAAVAMLACARIGAPHSVRTRSGTREARRRARICRLCERRSRLMSVDVCAFRPCACVFVGRIRGLQCRRPARPHRRRSLPIRDHGRRGPSWR